SFSPDGNLIATAEENGEAIVRQTADGKAAVVLRAGRAPLVDVQFSGDGKTVRTSAVDGATLLWDTATGKQLSVLIGGTSRFKYVGLSFTQDEFERYVSELKFDSWRPKFV